MSPKNLQGDAAMSIKTIIFALTVGLTLTCTYANATPMLERSNGDITGVSGLMVDGAIWNATFNDGSFDSINPTTPLLQPLAFAQAASSALYSFFDTSVPLADYDPDQIVGCTSTLRCLLLTAFDLSATTVTGRSAILHPNDPPTDNSTFNSYLNSTLDYADYSYVSWERAAVPGPPISLLMASGLIILRVTRRKRTA